MLVGIAAHPCEGLPSQTATAWRMLDRLSQLSWCQRRAASDRLAVCSTFITQAAKKVSEVGGSLRDVQQLAGHASLQTTQRSIERDFEAKPKLVRLI